MICKNCGHEQDAGKFCGRCGNPLVEQTDNTQEILPEEVEVVETEAPVISEQEVEPVVRQESEEAATVEPGVQAQQAQQTQQQQSQQNIHIENIKENSQRYVSFIKEYLLHPSAVVERASQNFINGLITFILLILLTAGSAFYIGKRFIDSSIKKFTGGFGSANMFEEELMSEMGMKVYDFLPFPSFMSGFLFMLALFGLSFGVVLLVLFISKQQFDIKEVIAIQGTYSLPAVILALLSFVLLLIGSYSLAVLALLFAVLIGVFYYPVQIAMNEFTQGAQLDRIYRGLIYFVIMLVVTSIVIKTHVNNLPLVKGMKDAIMSEIMGSMF